MKNGLYTIGILALAIIIGLFLWSSHSPQPEPTVMIATPEPVAVEPPPMRYPVETAEPDIEAAAPVIDLERPLPELAQSDERMEEILSKLFADQELERFFILEHFIERFVVMVDSLPRPTLPTTHRPVKKIPGRFLASQQADILSIAPDNSRRYTPLITMMEQVDRDVVVAVYRKLYPLFQQAYEGLGYPDAYFNDRLIAVIDHLLATPDVAEPIMLIRPKTLYLYANPELEALSAGQKILLRIGLENSARIKVLLTNYRQRLTAP